MLVGNGVVIDLLLRHGGRSADQERGQGKARRADERARRALSS